MVSDTTETLVMPPAIIWHNAIPLTSKKFALTCMRKRMISGVVGCETCEL
jgi:hypothetical protein